MKSTLMDLMEEPKCLVQPSNSLGEVLREMGRINSDYAMVVDNDCYIGTFLLTPSIWINTSLNEPIVKVMFNDIFTLSINDSIEDIALEKFILPIVPVLKNKQLKGVLLKSVYYTFKMGLYKDIMKTLRSQIQLTNENNKQLNEVMNHSYDGFAITNKKGITIKVNKAWDRLTGLQRENVLGIPLNDLVNKGYFSDSVTMKVMKDKEPVTIMQKMKSGKRAMMTGSPIFDDRGEIEHVIINIRDMTELSSLKRNLEHQEKLSERYQVEFAQIKSRHSAAESIVANSKSMQDLLEVAYRISRVESTVLLTGESGTGKGVIARYIHDCNVTGVKRPFIIVNCGAIPYELLESELFGYTEGAFTGASSKGKPGMFELADGGTLFLDEIAELPMNLQVKLLSVIQEKRLIRVRGTQSVNLDVRIIAATNQNLTELVERGSFREDLYYRLNVIPLNIPPLRSRKEDILPLSIHYLKVYNEKNSLNKKISEDLIDTLFEYDWPGNIRELANVIERMVVTSSNETLVSDNFPFSSKKGDVPLSQDRLLSKSDHIPKLQEARDNVEYTLIKRALEAEGTQAKAADTLGISLSTLIRKIKRLNIKYTHLYK